MTRRAPLPAPADRGGRVLACALAAAMGGGAVFAGGVLALDVGALRTLLLGEGGAAAMAAFTLGSMLLFVPIALATALNGAEDGGA